MSAKTRVEKDGTVVVTVTATATEDATVTEHAAAGAPGPDPDPDLDPHLVDKRQNHRQNHADQNHANQNHADKCCPGRPPHHDHSPSCICPSTEPSPRDAGKSTRLIFSTMCKQLPVG